MWSETVGLVNGQHKYLTAETFGFKINANGSGLKKKQLWTVEPFPLKTATNNNNASFEENGEFEYVALKSHLNCYLAVDNFGNVTCDSDKRSDGARFTISICSMSNGQDNESIYWAFRNVQRGYFLGCTTDGMIICNAKMPQTRSELWHIHLIPARGATMFALKSVGRKRYARASISEINSESKSAEQIQVDATTPWGSETLFQFKYYEGGKYALLTSSCKYLTCDGSCIEWTPVTNGVKPKIISPTLSQQSTNNLPPVECLFTVEYHGGYIAFRDFQGRYLAGAGRASILRARSNNVSKDELFEFENAPIQISLRAAFNNKWVSIKQGVDLSANQNEVTAEYETFELKYNDKLNTWTIITKVGNYWSLGGGSAVQATSRDEKCAGQFKLKWNEDGTCSILAFNNGDKIDEDANKWICNRKSGQLYIGSQDPVKFYVMLQNRTFFNLRASTGSGFIGVKAPGSGKLESNKTTPDSILVEYANSDNSDDAVFNCCYFKMPINNKYWSIVDNNSVACDAPSQACGQQWIMELRNGSCVAIRMNDTGSYLSLTAQGAVIVANSLPEEVTLWEF